jgi:hypothetical protein
LVTISGGDTVGVFGIGTLPSKCSATSDIEFAVDNLTIANGYAGAGGGIANYCENGSVIVTNTEVYPVFWTTV